MRFRFHERIPENQPCASAGGRDHGEGFAASAEPRGEATDPGIAATGREGRPVQATPHAGTSAADATLPVERTATREPSAQVWPV